eukprot:8961119-Prorocentrum_lima.AAC.1
MCIRDRKCHIDRAIGGSKRLSMEGQGRCFGLIAASLLDHQEDYKHESAAFKQSSGSYENHGRRV